MISFEANSSIQVIISIPSKMSHPLPSVGPTVPLRLPSDALLTFHALPAQSSRHCVPLQFKVGSHPNAASPS